VQDDFIGSVRAVIIGKHTPQDVVKVPCLAAHRCK